MLGRHEMPTKLEVADKVVFGMTARQLLFLGMGIALGYVLYQRMGHILLPHVGHLPVSISLRILLGVMPIGLALAFAFIRPADRALETWGMALLHYTNLPKRCVWRPYPNEVVDDLSAHTLLTELDPRDDSYRAGDPDDEPICLGRPTAYQEIMLGRSST